MQILVLNAGSSSLKYKLFRMPQEQAVTSGEVDIGAAKSMEQAASAAIEQCLPKGIDAVGHRVVHGGHHFVEPTEVSDDMIAKLHELRPLDPLHNPTEVAMIEASRRTLPDARQFAVFDTAFHKTMPETAWRYALPRALSDQLQLRRYGFHGISYQYVSELFGKVGRLIICHLGSGASVCAIKDGKSLDTSMGFTPLEGLIMGTRAGDVDPGLLIYLLRTASLTLDELSDSLNLESGLLGLSGFSNDVRSLEAAGDNPQAKFALDAFAYRVRKYIGSYAAVLGGVDTLVFTGGIGEHSQSMRSRICEGLEFLGIHLDPVLNSQATGKQKLIGTRTWMVPTNEELQIAREVFQLETGRV